MLCYTIFLIYFYVINRTTNVVVVVGCCYCVDLRWMLYVSLLASNVFYFHNNIVHSKTMKCKKYKPVK